MTARAPVVIGIDGGGTTTRVFCADLTGEVRSAVIGGGANPYKTSEATTNVQSLIRAALQKACCKPKDVRALVAGISGYETASDETWAESLTAVPELACPRRPVNDAVVAHVGAFNREPGILAIGGTGSMVYGVTESGKEVRNYDFNNSPLASARGIAYQAVFRILIGDFVTEDLSLVQAVWQYWNVSGNEELRDLALQNVSRDPREVMRRYGEMAPLITRAAKDGLPLACQVCDSAAEALSVAIRLVGICFASDMPSPIPVALIGSVLRSDSMTTALQRHLASASSPRPLRIMEPLLPPGLGAVVLALEEASVTVTPEILASLQQGMS